MASGVPGVLRPPAVSRVAVVRQLGHVPVITRQLRQGAPPVVARQQVPSRVVLMHAQVKIIVIPVA